MNETTVVELEGLIESASCISKDRNSSDRSVSDANEKILDFVKRLVRDFSDENNRLRDSVVELIEEVESLEGYAEDYRPSGPRSEDEVKADRSARVEKYLHQKLETSVVVIPAIHEEYPDGTVIHENEVHIHGKYVQ